MIHSQSSLLCDVVYKRRRSLRNKIHLSRIWKDRVQISLRRGVILNILDVVLFSSKLILG
jgi:hypothetical protein